MRISSTHMSENGSVPVPSVEMQIASAVEQPAPAADKPASALVAAAEKPASAAEKPPARPEIFFALVGAIGTPLHEVRDKLASHLDAFGYDSTSVRLSHLLQQVKGLRSPITAEPAFMRVSTSMAAGTELRERTRRASTLASVGIAAIRRLRKSFTKDEDLFCPARAYLVVSLKHRDEVTLLRQVYGEHLVIIGVHTNRAERVDTLAESLGTSTGERAEQHRSEAEQLMARDESEVGRKMGQQVQNAFPEADFFVDTATSIDRQVDRLLRIFFAEPCVTPTLAETGMCHARTAALRSAALGRQVGAAILESRFGDVLAVGTNEVPKAGGGHYWPDDPADARDFQRGHDANDKQKKVLVREALKALEDAEWLAPSLGPVDDSLVAKATAKVGPLGGTGLLSITEFHRDVHAEMSAIMSASRRGVSVTGSTLFCTTFPCHNCTKHIVAAGIAQVIYVEPYAKSYAFTLHADAITRDRADGSGRVVFAPFVGVAPRRYNAWFAMADDSRKDANGLTLSWKAGSAGPRFAYVDPGYVSREQEVVENLGRDLLAAGLELEVTDEQG